MVIDIMCVPFLLKTSNIAQFINLKFYVRDGFVIATSPTTKTVCHVVQIFARVLYLLRED